MEHRTCLVLVLMNKLFRFRTETKVSDEHVAAFFEEEFRKAVVNPRAGAGDDGGFAADGVRRHNDGLKDLNLESEIWMSS
jgi:hypothetical protein